MMRWKNGLMGLGLFLWVFLLLESLGRVLYPFVFSRDLRVSIDHYLGLQSEYAGSAGLFKPHHYLVYTLNPEGPPRWGVNSTGFRGPEIAKEKPGGIKRIACLGGSTTFGYFQDKDVDTYPRLLESLLNSPRKEPAFQVINAGVPGWTSAETLINLHFRLLEYAPDILVIYEGLNDLFAMGAEDEGASDYSHWRTIPDWTPLRSGVRHVLRLSHFSRTIYFLFQRAQRGSTAAEIMGLAQKPLPSNKVDNLTGSTGKHFKRNLEGIAALAQARGIRLIFVTVGHGPYHPKLRRNNEIIRDVARKFGGDLVDFERAADAPDYFTVDHVHLTLEGNRRLAAEVERVLRGKIPRTPS